MKDRMGRERENGRIENVGKNGRLEEKVKDEKKG